MILNFSDLSSTGLFGKILRWPLRWIPAQKIVPIIQGPLRGEKWIVGSGVHGYWLGSFESRKCLHFHNLVKPGDIVYDLGAHVGYYTLIASKLVGAQGKVISFEPNPKNLIFLRSHVVLNHIANVKVIESAVADYTGVASFIEGSSSSEGRLSTGDGISVEVTSLDHFLKANPSLVPDVMKIDVEGAERDVLAGAERLLNEYHPVILLATHSGILQDDCLAQLGNYGYDWKMITLDEILALVPQFSA